MIVEISEKIKNIEIWVIYNELVLYWKIERKSYIRITRNVYLNIMRQVVYRVRDFSIKICIIYKILSKRNFLLELSYYFIVIT
jgi:hypothetical protein